MATKIHELDLRTLELDTKSMLYWMYSAIEDLKQGKIQNVHMSLTAALNRSLDLNLDYKKIQVQNDYNELDINFSKLEHNASVQAFRDLYDEKHGFIEENEEEGGDND